MGTMLGGAGNLREMGGLPGNWAEMTPEQKRDYRLKNFVNPPNVDFVSEEAGNNYRIRAQRIADVICVREPDRVPVNLPVGNLPYTMYGITLRTAMYDYEQAVKACLQFNEKYSDELEHFAAPWITPARVMEILDYKLYTWPGHGTPMKTPSYQFIENEYMTADEYDALILDPSDFWFRTYMPRIFGAFKPFGMLRPWTDMVEIVNLVQLMPFASPEMQDTLQRLIEVGKEFQKFGRAMAAMGPGGMQNGYPASMGAFCKAPFDTLGDSLRGTAPILKDMYRRPEKLLEALDVVADFTIRSVLSSPSINNIFQVTYPLHKGADGWMSQKQFDTFYWPSLKKVMDAFIEQGLVQHMFAEGGYNTRLDSINEFPKGMVSWYFDKTDMAKAKKALGDKCSIQGNVPSSLIVTSTPKEVKAYCRKLIEDCGPGGGYLLCAGCIPDDPKLENVRAMYESVKEYGVYKK
ncbi:MAG: uroporphyrinogen decarboxylase [Acidobacteria bacterium]|nr:uroporphyrinogen decarboxylase [Acidobacteriota bacterium]